MLAQTVEPTLGDQKGYGSYATQLNANEVQSVHLGGTCFRSSMNNMENGKRTEKAFKRLKPFSLLAHSASIAGETDTQLSDFGLIKT